MKALSLLAILVLLTTHGKVDGQDADPGKAVTVQLPEFDVTTVSTVVSVPDGGVFLSGSRRIGTATVHKPGKEARGRIHIGNQILKAINIDGLATYNLVYDQRPMTIKMHDSGRIEIVVVRTFSEDDLDELATLHPDIYMHVRAFPKSSREGSKIRISVEAESTLVFESYEDLVARQPEYQGAVDLCTNHQPIMITVTPRIIIQEDE